MSIQEVCQRNPKTVTGAALLGIAIALFMLFMQVKDKLGYENAETQAFYTVDDGKSWFVDEASKFPPFDKDGKVAVQAHVYRCKVTKEPFVGFLQRYSEEARSRLPALIAEAKDSKEAFRNNMVTIQSLMASVEYKKPGNSKWEKTSVPVTCPNGHTEDLERVIPGQ
jgi:hypothetical protein